MYSTSNTTIPTSHQYGYKKAPPAGARLVRAGQILVGGGLSQRC